MFSNMKRLNLFMLAAIVAVSSVFVSCNKEDEPKASPSITFTYNGDEAESGDPFSAKIGDEVTIIATFVAPGEIASIEFKVGSDDLSPTEFDSATGHEISKTLKFTSAGSVTITAKVTDKQDPALSSSVFSITVAVTENDLGEAETFTLARPPQEGLSAENTTVGIRWIDNKDATIARFAPTVGATLVEITKTIHDGTATKEALVKAYNDGGTPKTDADRIECGPAGSSFVQKYFITKVNNNYFLVHMTGMTFNDGTNRAMFSYKQ